MATMLGPYDGVILILSCPVTDASQFAELFSWGETPWAGVPDREIIDKIQHRGKLACPTLCPAPLYDVMFACWKINASHRASAEDVRIAIDAHVKESGMRASLDRIEWPSMEVAPTANTTSPVLGVDLTSARAVTAFNALHVSASSITTDTVISNGHFSTVYSGTLLRGGTRERVAVRKMSVSAVPKMAQKQFDYEARMLSVIKHARIVRELAVCFDGATHIIVVELMAGGDLRTYLQHNAGIIVLSDTQLRLLEKACVQIASALVFLEERHVVHRNLTAKYHR